MQKVVYVGGGATSLTSAVLLKQRQPNVDVLIIEKSNKLGHKLSMTGGGKCNLAPNKEDKEVIKGYNNPEYIEKLFKEIPLDKYLSLLKEIGIETKKIKDYGYYPVNESAPTLVKILINKINKLGIKIINDEFVDFKNEGEKVKVILKNQIIECHELVLALGGLEKDILTNHHLKFKETSPGLCPIKVKEKISSIFGARMEADVSYVKDKKLLYKEHGEVMFKKDALSGICIMNIASIIARNNNLNKSEIIIDLSSGIKYLPTLHQTVEEYFLSITREIVADYLIKRYGLDKNHQIQKDELEKYYHYISHISFTPISLYDYKDGQVTIGGYEVDNKIHHVHLLGEMKNIDGLCGGYNLRYAISEGFAFALSFLSK